VVGQLRQVIKTEQDKRSLLRTSQTHKERRDELLRETTTTCEESRTTSARRSLVRIRYSTVALLLRERRQGRLQLLFVRHQSHSGVTCWFYRLAQRFFQPKRLLEPWSPVTRRLLACRRSAFHEDCRLLSDCTLALISSLSYSLPYTFTCYLNIGPSTSLHVRNRSLQSSAASCLIIRTSTSLPSLATANPPLPTPPPASMPHVTQSLAVGLPHPPPS
jgi:hypothetical protein